jgi:leader peptidase (prepilin peptidase)/N-methyltransferase
MHGPATFSSAIEWLFAVWFFALGGAIGSFLNVVVYRLPLGMSLSAPGSHCPTCKHPIRWHDNVPILGWIFLGGRCRDCRSPISMRYPIVEAIAATIFLAVGCLEGLSFGANLPLRPIPVIDGTLFAQLGVGQIAGIVAYHLLLLATLLAAALIEYDGQRLPVRLFLPALTVGGIAPLVWPHLHPVPALVGLNEPLTAALDGAAGLVAGLILGLAARWLIGPPDRRGLWLGPACIGLFLGWQAIAVLGPLACFLHWGTETTRRWWPGLHRISPCFWLLSGALVWILAWSRLSEIWPL